MAKIDGLLDPRTPRAPPKEALGAPPPPNGTARRSGCRLGTKRALRQPPRAMPRTPRRVCQCLPHAGCCEALAPRTTKSEAAMGTQSTGRSLEPEPPSKRLWTGGRQDQLPRRSPSCGPAVASHALGGSKLEPKWLRKQIACLSCWGELKSTSRTPGLLSLDNE